MGNGLITFLRSSNFLIWAYDVIYFITMAPVNSMVRELMNRLKKTFFMLNSTEHKIIMLINDKRPTIVGIIDFISMTNTISESFLYFAAI